MSGHPSRIRRCQICGIDSADVAAAIVRWRDPLPGAEYDSIDRCTDRAACRARCDAIGELWPVVDPGEIAAVGA